MDKCKIIRLLEGGRSKRSVSKELNIHRSTVTKYWKEYLQKREQIAFDTMDPSKKEALTAEPTYNSTNRTPRKYTDEMDRRIDELLEFDNEKAKKLGPHKQKLTTRSIHEILMLEKNSKTTRSFYQTSMPFGIPGRV